MWVTVEADIASVVCNFTGETWYLICRGTAWVGELGNCSKGKANKQIFTEHSHIVSTKRRGIQDFGKGGGRGSG